MGVPPPLGKDQTKFYSVLGLPGNEKNQKLKDDFRAKYKKYVQEVRQMRADFNKFFRDKYDVIVDIEHLPNENVPKVRSKKKKTGKAKKK